MTDIKQAKKNAAPERIARVIPKKDTQAMIKALRNSGLEVVKYSCGLYRCTMIQHQTKDGVRTGSTRELKLFTAMPGRNGYLVSMVSDLFGG